MQDCPRTGLLILIEDESTEVGSSFLTKKRRDQGVKGAEKDKTAAGGYQIRESADFQTSNQQEAAYIVSAKCKWTEWSAFLQPEAHRCGVVVFWQIPNLMMERQYVLRTCTYERSSPRSEVRRFAASPRLSSHRRILWLQVYTSKIFLWHISCLDRGQTLSLSIGGIAYCYVHVD